MSFVLPNAMFNLQEVRRLVSIPIGMRHMAYSDRSFQVDTALTIPQANIVPKVDDYQSEELIKSESLFCHRISIKFAVTVVTFAVLGDAYQGFKLGTSNLPTWPFRIKISRTFLMNIFRTSR